MSHLVANRLLVTGVCIISLGCSHDTPKNTISLPLSGPSASSAASQIITGYQHDLLHSRFPLGPDPIRDDSQDLMRYVGSEGVFAVWKNGGGSLAIPNGNSPILQAEPLTHVEEVHNQRVLEYFLQAGLPKEQVHEVLVSTWNSNVESANSPSDAQSLPKFRAFYSQITRKLGEIPVVGSFAWARFDAQDRAVEEGVFWPELPASVEYDVAVFNALLKSVDTFSQFRRKISQQNPLIGDLPGILQIRHRTFSDSGSFWVRAEYAIPVPGNPARIFTYLSDGTPSELPDAEAPSQRSKP